MEQARHIDGQKFRMAFLDASDGPRVMLFGPPEVDVSSLQRYFRNLSKGMDPIQLEKQDMIIPFGGIEVLAKCSGSVVSGAKGENRQGIYRIAAGFPRFEWTRSAEGWDYLAELIDSLVPSAAVGHQYLTRYPGEDAIVVVSKGEYRDEVVAKAICSDT